jgi:hypothetical protein
MHKKQSKYKQYLNIAEVLLKWVVSIAAFGFIGYKIYLQFQSGGFEPLIDLWKKPRSIFFFVLAFLAVGVNWGLESLKWKKLVNVFQKLDFHTAYKSVLAGVTVSILTPNRIGEFAGRVLFLKPNTRLRGVLASLAGSLAQLISTFLFGLIGIAFLLIYHQSEVPVLSIFPYPNLLLVVLVLLFFVILIAYFRIKDWGNFFKGKKISAFLRVFKSYGQYTLFKILNLSVLRYLVFCVQFHFLILMFGAEISHTLSLMLIFTGFLVTTLIPTIAMTELTTRASVAVLLFEPFGVDALSIGIASLILWIINLAIPALIGIVFLQKATWFVNTAKP